MTDTSNAQLPQVGDVAPDFVLPAVLPDGARSEVALKDLVREISETNGRGVIVYFYPKAQTPGCTTQACDFRGSLAPLRQAGYLVVGISPDGLDALDRFRQADHLTFPLASDPQRDVAKAYGAFGERTIMGRLRIGLIRSTFVVGPDGRLTHVQRNVKAAGHVARLRAELAA